MFNINNVINELDGLFSYAVEKNKYVFDVDDSDNNKYYQVNIKVSGIAGDGWKLCVITDKEDISIQYVYVSDKGNWTEL
ncbi:hypothetical protein [Candidatus Symbiopectobacterium sp. NZEC135]|uniref:hypothetical protein n=1 Tax=Candidatus Symbiopectobacterium sp. NZEC135 TaxID=2820471 RepID=UPI0022279D82|nr:hypothetical protein [Candidatus Symbiopectobacterium sp. NZEC135]MCW2478129.1 hypothetical protein [Candidatus Symbiopectobacterium sp. NZEC135]